MIVQLTESDQVVAMARSYVDYQDVFIATFQSDSD